MRSAYRTPSPEKAASDGSRKHSPWTAQRARKKGKNSPDAKLPGVDESDMEEFKSTESQDDSMSQDKSAREMALHLAQNPFLDHAHMPLAFGPATGLEGLAARTTHRSLVLQSSQDQREVLDRHHSVPFFCPNWQLQPPALAANNSLLQSSLHSSALNLAQSLHFQQQPCNGMGPDQVMDAPCTSTIQFGGRAKENAPPDLYITSEDREHACQTSGRQLSTAFPLKGGNAGGEVLGWLPSINTDVMETLLGGPLPTTSRDWDSQPRDSMQFAVCKDAAIHTLHLDYQHDQEHPLSPRPCSQAPSVAATPSPRVLAPGIRVDTHGRVPPRVPSSCRTIRRVLVDSPESSAGWQSRPCSGRNAHMQMQGSDATRAVLKFGGRDGEDVPMSVEKLLHEPKRRLGNQAVFETVEEGDSFDTLADNHNTGSTLTWFPHHTTPDATGKLGDRDYMEQEGLSDFDGDSPEFVLARGNITPDNLLPELEEEQGPRGPVKSSSCCSISRSGELSTFDERLHQAVQNGDAMTLGQAWQDVKSGTVKADDIDTLNTLLKCFCKVQGDPVDAEEIVKEVCKDGRLLPNASTYHHLATIWTRHDQLNNSE